LRIDDLLNPVVTNSGFKQLLNLMTRM